MQELLRHGSSRVTLDTYTQALTVHKRKAQSDVIRLFRALVLVAAEPQAAIAVLCLFVPFPKAVSVRYRNVSWIMNGSRLSPLSFA